MTDKEKLDAIRAEIHRLVDVRGYDRGMANDLFAFMDSLPNEPVSNDLEKEFDNYTKDILACDIQFEPFTHLHNCAKYFFELGMMASNPITATDRGMVEEIIINLKRVEQDYCIDLTKEMEWLRSKAQKGE